MFFGGIGQTPKSMSLCVEDCPVPLNNATSINTVSEFIEYSFKANNYLCHYSISRNQYYNLVAANFSERGPCPALPIYKSFKLINRCIPVNAKSFVEELDTSVSKFHLAELQNIITRKLTDLLFEFLNQAYNNEVAIAVACGCAAGKQAFVNMFNNTKTLPILLIKFACPWHICNLFSLYESVARWSVFCFFFYIQTLWLGLA